MTIEKTKMTIKKTKKLAGEKKTKPRAGAGKSVSKKRSVKTSKTASSAKTVKVRISKISKTAKISGVEGGSEKAEILVDKIERITDRDAYSIGVAVRGKFINPEKVVADLDFEEGMKVADMGAGTGYFVFPIAKKIGDGGVIFALDVVREKLESIESQAKISGISNIITQRVSLEERKGTGIPDRSMDWAILVNVLFQNRDKKAIISEAGRILKRGGRILILEWNGNTSSIGPPLKLRIPKEMMMEMAGEEELKFEKEIDVSDFHYGLIFIKRK